MFCPHCGKQIEEQDSFCSYCGTHIDPPQVSEQSVPVQPAVSSPEPSMFWFRFLIYLGLWGFSAMQIMSAINIFTGRYYGGQSMADFIYEHFPKLKISDSIYGISLLILGVLVIFIRFRLAKFRKHAPLFLVLILTLSTLIGAAYVYYFYDSVASFFGNMQWYQIVSPKLALPVIISAVMVIVNLVYFRKRRFLFDE